MHVENFSTDQLTRYSDSVRGWESANRRLIALDFNTKPLDGAFHASVQVCSSGRLRFTSLQVSAHVTTNDGLRPAPDESYHLLAYLKRGRAVVSQDGREAVLSQGDFVIVDACRPFCIDAQDMEVHSVDIASSRIREILPQADGLTGIRIGGTEASGAILHGLVDTIFRHAIRITESESDYLADALHYAAASALTGLPAASGVMPNQRDSYHRHQIRSFVRKNLRDRTLDPEMIARSQNLSLRGVHKLFEDEPQSLMKWIWSERVERCRADIANPALASRSVSQIAYSWGFSDPAHFSRLFKSQIGCPPSAIRA